MSRFARRFLSITATAVICAAAALCPAAENPDPKPEKAAAPPAAEAAATPPADPNVVAAIGEYQITKDEVLARLMEEIRPYDEVDLERVRATNSTTVARMLVAEKAMIIDARKNGMLEDEMIASGIKEFRSHRIVALLMQKLLDGKISATTEEVQAVMKANPKVDEVTAKAYIEKAKASNIIQGYYNRLLTQVDVQKVSENLPKVVETHRKLMEEAKGKSPMVFIRNQQVRELSDDLKSVELARFKGGVFTLKDFFDALCYVAPPRRPTNLNTVTGVEKFLDDALRLPILVVDAESKGLGEDERLKEMLKQQEDMRLLSKAKMDLFDSISQPADEQIIAYFNEHKDDFAVDQKVKIDQIWCENRAQAEKVKAELDEGKDFEEIKQKYSINKESKPFDTYRSSEGLFWDDVYSAEPGAIVGPIKGFYRDSVNWRVVKILEKHPGEPMDLSEDDNKDKVKWKLFSQLRYEAISKKYNEMLAKYPYTLYEDRLKAIDPLDIE